MRAALPARSSFKMMSIDASVAAQQIGLPVCVEVMLPGRMQVHYVGPADHR